MPILAQIVTVVALIVGALPGISTHLAPSPKLDKVDMAVSITFTSDAYEVVKNDQNLQNDLSNVIQAQTAALPTITEKAPERAITFYSPVNTDAPDLGTLTGISTVTQEKADKNTQKLIITTAPPTRLISAILSYDKEPTVAKVLLDYTTINILIEPKANAKVYDDFGNLLSPAQVVTKASDVVEGTKVFTITYLPPSITLQGLLLPGLSILLGLTILSTGFFILRSRKTSKY